VSALEARLEALLQENGQLREAQAAALERENDVRAVCVCVCGWVCWLSGRWMEWSLVCRLRLVRAGEGQMPR
jgi:hypothetical protein